ncbi:MAG: type II secretion system protein [Candidatus Omnitrophota bacterium]
MINIAPGIEHRAPKKAFTFVETMIVLALFGILGVSLFSSFSMGMKVWKRATSTNLFKRKAVLTIERLSMELRRTFNYASIGFLGDKAHIEFPGIIANKIYNLSYDFFPEEKCVKRSGISRQEMLSLEDGNFSRIVIPQVKDFTLSYYGADNQTGNYTFLESWNNTVAGIPAAVKVSVVLENGTNLEKIITIPIAQQ